MKLPTIDRFCFCLSLEIGAFVLAAISIITSISIVSVATTFLVRYIRFYNTLNEADQDFFLTFLIGFIILYAVYLIYFAIVIAASVMLVIGTINNNHNQMLLFIVIMGVGVIVSFFQIFQLGVVFLVPTILSAVVAVYFFICVYSLYKRLKNESMKRTLNGTHPQYENVNLRNI